jgi:DNA-binding LacI/PurR family transcriptional regulator
MQLFPNITSSMNDRFKPARVTAAIVGARAGVSKWTVLRAFEPGGEIAEETRRRIREVAKELNYQPNLLARSLATNRTHLVAVLVDDFSNPFMLPPLGYLAGRLQEEGFLALLLNINENYSQLRAITSARQRQVEAIVSFGVAFDPKTVIDQLAIDNGVPAFVLTRESTSRALPSVYVEAKPAIEAMSRYLYKKGYRRPTFFGGPNTPGTDVGRRRHYKDFWRKKGVSQMPEISASLFELNVAATTIREYFNDMFKSDRCDVLLCENDILAIAAVDVAKFEFGFAVPDDLAIVGFDDISLAGTAAYDLTTIRQSCEPMVDIIVDMIQLRRPRQHVGVVGEPVFRSSA